jgi:hypothetical protein
MGLIAVAAALLATGSAASGDDAPASPRGPGVPAKGAGAVLHAWLSMAPAPETWTYWRAWLTRPVDGPAPRARGEYVQPVSSDDLIALSTDPLCRVEGLEPLTKYSVVVKSWAGSDNGLRMLLPPYTLAGTVTLDLKTNERGAGAVSLPWNDATPTSHWANTWVADPVPQILVQGNPFEVRDPQGRVVLHGICEGFDPTGRAETEVRDAVSGVDVVAQMVRGMRRPTERLTVGARGLPRRAAADLFVADASGTLVRVRGALANRGGSVRFVLDAKSSAPLPFGEPDVTRFGDRAFEVLVDGRTLAAGTLPVYPSAPQGTRSQYLAN